VAKQNDTNSDFRYGRRVDTEPVHRYAYFQHFEELNIKVTFTLLEIDPKCFSKFENHFQSDQEKEDHIHNALIPKLI
jgi:hypothetical protein